MNTCRIEYRLSATSAIVSIGLSRRHLKEEVKIKLWNYLYLLDASPKIARLIAFKVRLHEDFISLLYRLCCTAFESSSSVAKSCLRILHTYCSFKNLLCQCLPSVHPLISPLASSQTSEPLPQRHASQVREPQQHADSTQRASYHPKQPLILIHVANVVRVHPEDGSQHRQRQEKNSHSCECQSCFLLSVFRCFDDAEMPALQVRCPSKHFSKIRKCFFGALKCRLND